MAESQKSLCVMDYTVKLNDGTLVDTTEGKEPFEFITGFDMVISGLEKQLLTLKKGAAASFNIAAEDAYGPYNPKAIQEVDKSRFEDADSIELGMMFEAEVQNGYIPVTVKEIKGSTIILDANHPLAGKDLVFDVQIHELRAATEDEIQDLLSELAHGHSCGCGCGDDDEDDSDCGDCGCSHSHGCH